MAKVNAGKPGPLQTIPTSSFTHCVGSHRCPSLTPLLLDLTMRFSYFFPAVEMKCVRSSEAVARPTFTVYKGQDAGVCLPFEAHCFWKVTRPLPYIIQGNLRQGSLKGNRKPDHSFIWLWFCTGLINIHVETLRNWPLRKGPGSFHSPNVFLNLMFNW